MLLLAKIRDCRNAFALFLGSVAVVLLPLALVLNLSAASDALRNEGVVAGCIVLGLGWVLLGWFLTPSVETYIGQGAMEGFPIIGPSFANPQRNEPVMNDLARKLSQQTDAGIASAGLGFLLMLVGGVYDAVPILGLIALLTFVAAALALLLLAFLPARRPAAPA